MYTVASNEVRTSAVSTGVGPLSVAVSKRVSPLCKPVSAVDGKMMIVDGIERKERTESHVYVEYIVSRDA
jgi:hypothetical protein